MHRLLPGEIPAFIQLRLEQLREEGSKLPPNLEASLASYYRRHMADGSFVSWVACRGGQIIATSGISLVEKPPYASNPSGKIALVSSFQHVYQKALSPAGHCQGASGQNRRRSRGVGMRGRADHSLGSGRPAL